MVDNEGKCTCDGPETGLGPTCSEFSNANNCGGVGVVNATNASPSAYSDPYSYGIEGSNLCPHGHTTITSESACRAAASAKKETFYGVIRKSWHPRGCYLHAGERELNYYTTLNCDYDCDTERFYGGGVYYNTHPSGDDGASSYFTDDFRLCKGACH